MVQLIEDHSPFYILFTHNKINDIVQFCLEKEKTKFKREKGFSHEKYLESESKKLLSMVPKADELKLIKQRVSLFIAQPKLYYRAHKDGLNLKIGINYPIQVLDNECTTSWYDDNSLSKYPIDNLGGYSREASGFIKENHTPLKSTIFKSNFAILFNTDIFHDFDNTKSSNIRVMLTFRSYDPTIDFNKAKEILFNN